MRQVEITARTDRDADCLMRELARYSPTRTQRSVTIQLDREITLLALLAAVETCLQTNEIADVSVKLDDKTYLLAPSR